MPQCIGRSADSRSQQFGSFTCGVRRGKTRKIPDYTDATCRFPSTIFDFFVYFDEVAESKAARHLRAQHCRITVTPLPTA